ncbi:MAG TPA: TolC family protein [Pirellulaceae bacterium]|nr:TolC family protein [Pirellulaceae bacterium]
MLRRLLAIAAILVASLAGCNLAGPNRAYDAELAHYKQVAATVDHPELTTPPSDNINTPEPRTLDHNAAPQEPREWWDMTVEEALQTALARTSVLRDLGGTVIRSPDTTRTILGPSLIATEPRFGMEAALSEFDATLASSVIAEKNDRMINNFVASGGTRFFKQDLINFQSQISKLGVAGTRMTLRGTSTYDFNNASFNRFPSVWDTLVEAELRQPLYQGAGARFNRLAGPNAIPGFYNGVLIARVNTDMSVAEFEIGIRDVVSNVENAYWDLYFAYRDLDARLQARNVALEAWRRVKVIADTEQQEGALEREAQLREQYFRYEEDVQNALAGTLQSSTTNNNGSSGGSFRGLGGVLVSERRLRLAIGLPITDGRMIRPADEPTAARVTFDWPSSSGDAIARRPELLRQRLAVKRREMEFVAARNFLLPRFDLLGRYRVRGLGKALIGDQVLPVDPADPEGLFENSSLKNLALGNFQEWQLGGEVSLPIGFRRGHAAVRNAQLFVAREKAVLEEQERQVIHDLSNALGDVDRTYKIMQTAYNRRLATVDNVNIVRTRIETGQNVTPEQLLESGRRLAEADIQYHKALVEHMLAIKNVHFEKGTLLEYGHIYLAEQVSIVNARPPPADVQQPTPAQPAEGIPPPPVEVMPAPQPAPPPQPMPPPPPATGAAPAGTGPAPIGTGAAPRLPLPLGEGWGEGLDALPVQGGLPPAPAQPQSPPIVVQPPQAPPVEGLPPAPSQSSGPALAPPAAETSSAPSGLPTLPSTGRAPILQWSRRRQPEQPANVNVPANPFMLEVRPQPELGLPPANQAPSPPPLPPPSRQVAPAPSPPPQAPRPSAAFIERLWYSHEPATTRLPNVDVVVPVQAPVAPPTPAAWQPPVMDQPVPTTRLPQPEVEPPPVLVQPAAPVPAPAMRLPEPAPEPPPVRLPLPPAYPPIDPAQRLPQPAPEARAENEIQRLPLPYP